MKRKHYSAEYEYVALDLTFEPRSFYTCVAEI